MSKMIFKTAYQQSQRLTFECDPVSLTHQSMSAECDINGIMAKFEKTGILEHRNKFEGNYGDFTDIPSDYQESMNAVLDAQKMFSELPAKLRRKFANDPGNFLEFVSDPSNKEEMIKLGLARQPTVDDQVIEPATPAPKKTTTPSEGAKKSKSDEPLP